MEIDWQMFWTALGSFATLVAALSTAVAAWQAKLSAEASNKALVHSQKIANFEIFMNFSEKYDELKARINRASWVRFENSSLEEIIKDTNPSKFGTMNHEDILHLLNLLDLFDKQYFIRKNGLIDDETWNVWKKGIQKITTNVWVNLIIIERNVFDTEHKISPDFVKFLNTEFGLITEKSNA